MNHNLAGRDENIALGRVRTLSGASFHLALSKLQSRRKTLGIAKCAFSNWQLTFARMIENLASDGQNGIFLGLMRKSGVGAIKQSRKIVKKRADVQSGSLRALKLCV